MFAIMFSLVWANKSNFLCYQNWSQWPFNTLFELIWFPRKICWHHQKDGSERPRLFHGNYYLLRAGLHSLIIHKASTTNLVLRSALALLATRLQPDSIHPKGMRRKMLCFPEAIHSSVLEFISSCCYVCVYKNRKFWDWGCEKEKIGSLKSIDENRNM